MNQKSLFISAICFFAYSFSIGQSFVNIMATGANDGSSWENAYSNLDTALAKTSSGDLWIAAGTYRHDGAAADSFRTFWVSSSVNLYGGFVGTETTLEERDN